MNISVVAEYILHAEFHDNTTSELSRVNFRRELSLLRLKSKTHPILGLRAHELQSAEQSDMHYLLLSYKGRFIVKKTPPQKKGKCVFNVKFNCMNNEHELLYHGQCFKITII